MRSYMEQYDNCVLDIHSNRYPYCIVWTPLPLITTLFPFIGHTGICTSEGIIHDFSGSYNVTIDDMAFEIPDSKCRYMIFINVSDVQFQLESKHFSLLCKF
ncbi:hypothetical protein SteCoe_40361 [Stentor coeruleus]|uniref:Uncharacterized protein n=1 Tax=Stentor coeruleus TaxID=5963 RepID=A0A1R2AKC3_9CILI|nr:hypothetical protein SteCoe_40361 [Stentor coeruleus]